MKIGLTLSFLGLILGLSIMVISLVSSNQVNASVRSANISQRQFYLGEEMLPDHLLYPFKAASDRARLQLAKPIEQVQIKLQFGESRFIAAQKLLDKNQREMALSTLTKSQKYYNLAAADALRLALSKSDKQLVEEQLKLHQQQVEALKPVFTDAQRVIIDQLLEESKTLASQLVD